MSPTAGHWEAAKLPRLGENIPELGHLLNDARGAAFHFKAPVLAPNHAARFPTGSLTIVGSGHKVSGEGKVCV